MKLYLLQHGLAVDKSLDPERPLSAQGRTDVERTASFLQHAGIKPALFLHSGKTRAQQTAQIMATALGDGNIAVLEHIDPNDALDSTIRFVARDNRDIMLVGHLPFMQRLVSFLLCGNEVAEFSYQPGTIACLFRDGLSHNNDKWSMQWMLRPDLLPDT